MPTERPTLLRSYDFSEAELLQAQILTTLNKQYIQTYLTQISEEKTNLDINYDLPNPIEAYAREVRYLQGQSAILVMLLNQSTEAEYKLAHPDQLAI